MSESTFQWRPFKTAKAENPPGQDFLVGRVSTKWVDRAFFKDDGSLMIVGAHFTPDVWAPIPPLPDS